MSVKTTEIALTKKQWSEIYYALDSKIAQLKIGYYGHRKQCDKKWIGELADIMDEIETKVEV